MIAAEIQPVRKVDGAMEWCDPSEADAFGVYTRDEDGLAVWVADCATHDDARRLVSALADDAGIAEGSVEFVLEDVLDPAEFVQCGTDRIDVFDMGDLIEAVYELLIEHGDEDARRIADELSLDALEDRCRGMDAQRAAEVIDEILQRAYKAADIRGGDAPTHPTA